MNITSNLKLIYLNYEFYIWLFVRSLYQDPFLAYAAGTERAYQLPVSQVQFNFIFWI